VMRLAGLFSVFGLNSSMQIEQNRCAVCTLGSKSQQGTLAIY
jgi:hypothetical protein